LGFGVWGVGFRVGERRTGNCVLVIMATLLRPCSCVCELGGVRHGFGKVSPPCCLWAAGMAQFRVGPYLERHALPDATRLLGVEGSGATLEATQGQILSQSPTDATRFWWHMYGS